MMKRNILWILLVLFFAPELAAVVHKEKKEVVLKSEAKRS